ncbi:MAG: DUF996 domain-containing protein [Thermococci archaeon]|nr:DUF996 domain-containing protein [Thermococci archaeon]
MGDLKSAKILGGIGAILTLVDLGFIGFILKLLGVKHIADATGNEDIFKKFVIAAVLWIVGLLVLFVSFFGAIRTGKLGLGVIGAGLIAAAIILLIGSWFLKVSYDLISRETEVGYFHTAGLLYFIGAILTFVLIGVFIIFIAAIVEVIAFFSLPDTPPKKSTASTAEFSEDEFSSEF